jgi:hypothetical protein
LEVEHIFASADLQKFQKGQMQNVLHSTLLKASKLQAQKVHEEPNEKKIAFNPFGASKFQVRKLHKKPSAKNLHSALLQASKL